MILKNEKGYTLLTTMLVFIIFMVLGVSILAMSIGGAKRTSMLESNVVTDLDAMKAIDEGVTLLKYELQKDEFTNISLDEYNSKLELLLQNIQCSQVDKTPTCFTIKNITPDDIEQDQYYTRVFDVSAVGSNGQAYRQKVFVTSMPSFLKYAAGSRGELTINGSGYFEGDLYANGGINMANDALYIYNGNKQIVNTVFPTIKAGGELILNGNASTCENSINNATRCYNQDHERLSTNWSQVDYAMIPNIFTASGPTVVSNQDYISVEVKNTAVDKFLSLESGLTENTIKKMMDQNSLLSLLSQDEVKDLVTDQFEVHMGNTMTNPDPEKSHLYLGNTLVKGTSINVNKDDWIIVNGDLTIENPGNERLEFNGNLIVTGNVTIRGDIYFDSVMYIIGNTRINDANINDIGTSNDDQYKDKELILMTEGRLELARFNKFQDVDKGTKLKAYLYTEQDAVVYAVGSYVYIEGGIFSNGSLTLNGFRGDAAPNAGDSDLKFTPPNDQNQYTKSRLTIVNNPKLFLDQQAALPRVDKLNVIIDNIEKAD